MTTCSHCGHEYWDLDIVRPECVPALRAAGVRLLYPRTNKARNAMYWLTARLAACWHALRAHDVQWRVNFSADEGCAGDIVCETCSVVLWCRELDPWRR